ncbi:TonB-dependent receptor domain-containing protein [uncultured Paludibaculum sp.]|uniref:TonB-dependent receptor n=1 Tax=uncultured Paludibaculum sp. TaxID=1765020 RepID=UPI002AAC0A82|nr:TonB-dependent receptor [uncultured Paludibaculum sp.]
MHRRLVPLAALLFLTIGPMFGQFDTGTILGSIHDGVNAPVPSAVVVIEEVRKGIIRNTHSTDAGTYEILSIPIGRYRLRVEQPGFRPQSSDEFELTIGARQRVDFTLELSTVQSSVQVNADVSILQSDSSDRGQTIAAAQIRELPLAGRAYSELIYLSTGIVRTPSSGVGSAQREASFSVNGLRSTANNFLLDGLDNNYFGTSNQGFSNQVVQPPPDAVAEFRVITNNWSAEYGRAGGATVNASLRSGTNQFHGAAWEFFRNTQLNAVGFFKPTTGQPIQNQNQFGAAFGGPVIRNHTFFFVDYEGYREVNSSVAYATLPNAAQRSGSLGVPVKNPFTGDVYTDGVIPKSAVIPYARAVLDSLPANTGMGAANNYQSLRRITDYRDKGDAKFDHYFSDNLRGFFRFSKSRFDVFDPGTLGGLAGGNGNGFQKVPLTSFAGGATWTINQSSILEARLGYSASEAGKDPPLVGGPSMLEMFGIPGLPTDKQYTGGITAETLISFTSFGRQATSPQYQHPRLWNPKVNYTRILGRHTLKAGVEYQWLGVETLDVSPMIGRNTYTGLFSAPTPSSATAATQGLYSLADFLMGARNTYQLVNPGLVNHRQQSIFTYLQDDFKVSRNLTLNLGVRYELTTPFYERDNKLSSWDPATNTIILAKDGSIFDRSRVHLDTNNLAPRLGMAWSLLPKTVLRAGYGIGFNSFNRTGTSYLAYNAPMFVLASASQTPGVAGFLNTQQGFPADFTAPEKFNPRKSTVQYIDPDSPWGTVQTWSISLQRELPKAILLEISYVGNKADHLATINDLNQARPNAIGENLNIEDRRPNLAYSSISGTVANGFSNYHGLQVRVEKRSDAGLYFLNSFTWAKAIDNSSQAFDSSNGNGTSFQNIYDIDADRGISNYDRKFNNITSLVYELPIGRGRRFLTQTSRLADLALGGWQINSIVNMRAGEPFTMSYTAAARSQVAPFLTLLGFNAFRPHISGDPMMPEAQRSVTSYLNRNTVFIPTYDQPFGNAGRNISRGFAFYQVDLGLSKAFTFTERVGLQFRAEAFNLLNKANFSAPTANISSAAFGTITSTYDPRKLQLALKLQF